MELAVSIIGMAIAGLAVGVLSGLLGIGGGMVMVPLLRLVFGLSAYAATATSLFAIVFTSISGGITHVRNKTCIPKLGIALGLGGSVTSVLGVYLGNHSPSWAIMLVAAIIIGYTCFTMLHKALKMPGRKAQAGAGGAKEQTASGQVAVDDATAEFPVDAKVLAIGFCIGLAAGLASGYVGVGGGFIMVPLMTVLLDVPMKKASGTSLIAILILAIPGVITQMLLGHVDYLAGLLMAVGTIPGAYLGARLIKRIPERELRFLFAGFLAVAAVLLVVNEFGILG